MEQRQQLISDASHYYQVKNVIKTMTINAHRFMLGIVNILNLSTIIVCIHISNNVVVFKRIQSDVGDL